MTSPKEHGRRTRSPSLPNPPSPPYHDSNVSIYHHSVVYEPEVLHLVSENADYTLPEPKQFRDDDTFFAPNGAFPPTAKYLLSGSSSNFNYWETHHQNYNQGQDHTPTPSGLSSRPNVNVPAALVKPAKCTPIYDLILP